MRYLVLLISLAPALVFANDSTIDAAAKGALVGGLLGAIAGFIALCVYLLRKLFGAAKKAVPVVINIAEHGASKVQDFANRNKPCPFCAQMIKREAIVCHFCKRDLPHTD